MPDNEIPTLAVLRKTMDKEGRLPAALPKRQLDSYLIPSYLCHESLWMLAALFPSKDSLR
jgi:hypothetical protein